LFGNYEIYGHFSNNLFYRRVLSILTRRQGTNPIGFFKEKVEMENTNNLNQTTNTEALQVVDPRIDLAIERTSLALERTQLAWVRTVIGFITAGFAIDKATTVLYEARLVSGVALSKNGHFAGLLLTGVATVLMIVVTITYVRRTLQLSKMRVSKERPTTSTTLLSIFVCLIGGITIYFLDIPW